MGASLQRQVLGWGFSAQRLCLLHSHQRASSGCWVSVPAPSPPCWVNHLCHLLPHRETRFLCSSCHQKPWQVESAAIAMGSPVLIGGASLSGD